MYWLAANRGNHEVYCLCPGTGAMGIAGFLVRAEPRPRVRFAARIVTPAQIIHDLPNQLPLPSLIVLQSAQASPDSPTPQTNAVIPAEDLKPLYDSAIDCKTCQAKVAAAQGDLADERNKTTALTRERDDALRIARGGSAWRRIGRAAKWFAIGAAAGAVAAKTAH